MQKVKVLMYKVHCGNPTNNLNNSNANAAPIEGNIESKQYNVKTEVKCENRD